jgi:hypothetical protein
MPALSPEQRKRQRQLQIQREEENARAMAPRRGSKVARSSMKGAATKGETVGGAPQRVSVKNSVKSKQLTADEARTPKVEAGKSDPEFRRPTPADKKPATPPVKASAQRTTAMPASRMTPPIPKPKQETKAAAQSYRDKEDTKGTSVGRYRTLSEHLAAVQANKAMKIGSKMDTKSDVYTPSTKVDGGKMDTSKVTSKTKEYDKKKRKNLK